MIVFALVYTSPEPSLFFTDATSQAYLYRKPISRRSPNFSRTLSKIDNSEKPYYYKEMNHNNSLHYSKCKEKVSLDNFSKELIMCWEDFRVNVLLNNAFLNSSIQSQCLSIFLILISCHLFHFITRHSS